MLTIPVTSISFSGHPTEVSNALSGTNSVKQRVGTRDEAIHYIKTLTHNQYGEQFEEGNTIGSLRGKTEIPLRTIELENGEKQYFATANMDPRRCFHIEKNHSNKWNMNDLYIEDYNSHQVVFIFSSEFSSDIFPIGMNLSTEEIEEIGNVSYVYCNQNIKFPLHKSRFDDNEIAQKSEMINITINERRPELIQLLKNCTSRNIDCSSSDAVELCEKFPHLFDSTNKITPELQINALKLANEIEKYNS
ncbi:hypothetical protein [Yersinia thracica]|uniref:hypothetical protein n=1 Tax=Yersinia thracica TaxID=2890319 RepID=UPI001F410F7F|nr:hypothetical protein [Yersinia thracica]